MANPTTNFGWVMPTSTDLVTDLPADFNVFGQGVDTSMQYLLGGTTGQVLSKTSGTNMAFTWVTPTDQTPLTTKGDLFTFTTVDARLGVGTNGQILSANSAQATGLEWVTPNPGDITAVNVTSPITGGGTSGDVTISIQDALTTQKGAVQLSDSTSTTSSILAATPTAVKSAYDLAAAAIAKSTLTTAGDVIYRNATVPTRLGIGTAGQVLTVNSGATAPQWATVATASSGMTFISRTSFSNVASQAIDNVFSSSYYNYLVIIERISAATATNALQMQMRYGSTTATGANYNGTLLHTTRSNTNTTNLPQSSATEFTLASQTGDSTQSNSFSLSFVGVGNTSENPSWSGTGTSGNGTYGALFLAGSNHVSQTYTGFLLKSASSNITGIISVYGLAKA